MFLEESFVTSLFKILNVIVLCGVGLYFFKTKIYQQIKDAMAEKRKAELLLQEEKRVAKNRLKMIENEIIEQQALVDRVKTNLTTWSARVVKEQEQFKQGAHERSEVQATRVKIQSEHLTKLKLQQQVLPQALESAQTDLEKNFMASRGHAYMQQLIHRMRRV